jgi:predicted MPP superfamily phosphohydrolase
LEDLFRLGAGSISYFIENDDNTAFFSSRRKFVSQVGLGLAAIPFMSLIYGITIGRYNYKVIKRIFSRILDAFDGFTITQISDVHSGSFDNPEKISYAIDLVNEQNSDMILFTGDIVNTDAKEMHPWIETFNRIKKHEYGKYSVLGNHDYGEYVTWPTEVAKEEKLSGYKSLWRN